MTTINAHFIGHVFVPDEPVELAEGAAVELNFRRRDGARLDAAALLSCLPLLAPEDAEDIHRDAEFAVEEA